MQEIDKPAQPLVVPQARDAKLTPRPPVEVELSSPGPMWPRYIEALFKRKVMILGALLGSLLLAWLALIVWPKQYQSEAKLMIRVGRESVALDPSATTSQTLMLQKTQEEEVNSALDLLRSRRIAELTVDKFGAQNINSGVLPSGQYASLPPWPGARSDAGSTTRRRTRGPVRRRQSPGATPGAAPHALPSC